MQLRVTDEIWDAFPGLHLGLVFARGIDNSRDAPEVKAAVQEVQSRIRAEYETETLSQIPWIQAWRRAFSAFGAKPKKYKSSVESLYRMILKGTDLRSINPVVDIYNLVSLRFGIPAGGDDLDNVEGDILLTFAAGGEEFIPLNSEIREEARPGEVIYRDEQGVLCRRWNWRECDRTKMTRDTRNVSLVVEGLPPVGRAEMEGIVAELAGLIFGACGGVVRSAVLDLGLPEIGLDVET
ncbi:MAG: phenylalanine--tRNA ligase beta subunit-related protein [Candidatus Aminicenantaceae bacterium]